jgi:hypothetical protein
LVVGVFWCFIAIVLAYSASSPCRLFPRYFQLSTVTLMLSTAASLATLEMTPAHKYILAAANIGVLLNYLFFEPKTTAVMFREYR